MSYARDNSDLTAAALETVLQVAKEIHEREKRPPLRLEPSDRTLTELVGIELSDDGHEFPKIAEALRRLMLATPSSADEGFFNQLFGGRDPVATMAEMLTPMLNTSMYTFKVAGPQILVERAVLQRLLSKAGLSSGEGAFVPGGSIANLLAMIIARYEIWPAARNTGCTDRELTAYTSDESHYSIRKNGGLIGLGRDNVRHIRTDSEGRMIVADLLQHIRADRAQGRLPFFVNATAGTTVLGAFDPIEELAELTASEGIWLHVDGAFGATVLLSERHRHLMTGVEQADSLTWDAHKMMGVPLSCSTLLLKKEGLLARCLDEDASYLFQTDEDEFNPGKRSFQCGRRNDALKLWAAWLHHGDRGYEERIDHLFALASHAARRIAEDPEIELVTDPESVNVCFEVRGRSSATICNRLDEEARLKIGYGSACGRSAIRLVCVNPDLEESDIDRVLAEVKSVARDLPEK